MHRTIRATAAALLGWMLAAAAPPVEFVPTAPSFSAAAAEYRVIWKEDGARIAAALEQASGLVFPQGKIAIFVSDGRPMASYDGQTIRMRAGYTPAYKRGALVHELGHRLTFTLARRGGLDDHRLLDLFLYEAWASLYGTDFADNMVRIERMIPGPFDYDAAWNWALAQSPDERRARLAALRAG